MRVNRARMNYWVDVAIGVAGVVSAISGLIFLLPGDLSSGVLGLSYQAWSGVHTWSSLAVVLGVGVHLVLHWKWVVSMTKEALSSTFGQTMKEPASSGASGGEEGRLLGRRAFLTLGGAAAVATGLMIAGYKAIFDTSPADASQPDSRVSGVQQESGVACPFGLVDDPYPGRCRRYVDSNGDGICDYSVPGSGRNLASGGGGSVSGGFRHRPGFGQP
jgi:hypothetical protein